MLNCLQCAKLIKRERTGPNNMRKFCNRSCAASYNNRLHPKRQPQWDILTRSDLSQTQIRQHSRYWYIKSGRPLACAICDYNKHVEICHIKDVQDFPQNAKITTINEPENLVALCRNHHWEFDNGHLTL